MINWSNKGIAPSTEKQQNGYSAGEKLPAGHLNYFLNQFSTNINKFDGIFAEIPSKVVFGVCVGDGETSQQIDLGFRPYGVIIQSKAISSNGKGGILLDGYPIWYSDTTTDEDDILARINDNGFEIFSRMNYLNKMGVNYYYIAFAPYTETEE